MGHRARHHTRRLQSRSQTSTATSVHAPARAPNSRPRFTAPTGLNVSNTGTPTRADRATTAAATPSLAWRGTARSRTSMPNRRRSQSVASPSRLTGHTQPQKARPRTSP